MYKITPDLEGIEKYRQTASNAPVGMVNLLKFNGEEGMALFEEYRLLSQSIARRLGVSTDIVYRAQTGPDFSGGEDWDAVAIVRYHCFEDFARLMTDREYLEKATPIRDRALAKAVLMVSEPPATSGDQSS
jgi:hypothetical protein